FPGPPPPPPVGPGITLRISRDWVVWPFLSVALNRMIELSQLRFGYGDFMHVSPPSEKIPSPAARSGYMPESVIFWGWAHGSPVPYQAVIVAYTEFTFRSPSGSETCAKTKKPSPDWTGSIAVEEYSPSAHLWTNTG